MYFIGEGIDHLHIEGDSFVRQDDRRKIFRETKLGTHRLFEQEWIRQGDAYELESEVVLPTPYHRLVEFVYGISHQAASATQDMVTDPALIQKAIDVGLIQNPIGLEWEGYCGEGAPLSPPPCTVLAPRGTVMIDMVEVNGDWLISAISP
jgi:hypothetical protein